MIISKPLLQKITVVAAGLLFLMHFGLTALYISDGDWLPYKVRFWVGRYMIPQFHQNWSLFAPEPPVSDIFMFVRYTHNGDTTQWKEPAYHHALMHPKNPLSYHGKLHRIHRHIIRNVLHTHYFIAQSVGESAERWQKLKVSETYGLAEKYTLDYASDLGLNSVDAYQICYVGRYPKLEGKGLRMEYEFFKFPWVQL